MKCECPRSMNLSFIVIFVLSAPEQQPSFQSSSDEAWIPHALLIFTFAVTLLMRARARQPPLQNNFDEVRKITCAIEVFFCSDLAHAHHSTPGTASEQFRCSLMAACVTEFFFR